MSGSWPKNHGLRIDHFLVSNNLLENVKKVSYHISLKKLILRRLVMGVADGIMKADGKPIYEEKDINVRIGIHLGATIFENGDIRGEGVNIASRLEPLTDPGGICVSERVHEDIKNKNIDFLYLNYRFFIFDQHFALWDTFIY